MNRLSALTITAALLFSPAAAFAAEQACSPAQAAAAKLSSSGLSCTQWVAQFDGASWMQTAHADKAAAPHS